MVALLAFCAGILAGRVRPGWRGACAHLDRWVIRIALPALILAEIPGIEASAEILVAPAVAWVVTGLGAIAVLLVSRDRGWSAATTGTLLLVVPLGNTSFLGIPAVETLLGPDHVPSAIAFDQLGSFLALTVYGGFVTARFGARAWSWRGFLRRLIGFTPFVALVAAVAVRAVGRLPGALEDVMSGLGSSVGPVALASLGLRLRLGVGSPRGIVVGALLWRLVAVPAMVLAAAVLVGDATTVVWQASILESAMPPMVTAGILAAQADLDGDLAASVVGWGTLCGLATVSLWGFALA
jgi:hypothetical protein